MGSQCLRLAGASVDEGFTDWCRGLSILAHTQTYRAAAKRKDHSDRMWRRAHSGSHLWRKTLLLGRRRLWTVGTPRHSTYAQGWRWLPISAKAKDDPGSQRIRYQGGLLWKGPYCCSSQKWSPLLLGCWSMWSTWTSRYVNISSWRGWVPLPTNSQVCLRSYLA